MILHKLHIGETYESLFEADVSRERLIVAKLIFPNAPVLADSTHVYIILTDSLLDSENLHAKFDEEGDDGGEQLQLLTGTDDQ